MSWRGHAARRRGVQHARGEVRPRIRRWLAGIRFARIAIAWPLASLAILPLHSFVGAETSLMARLVVTGMLVLAIVRPDHALLVCAGLAPLAGSLGTLLGSPVSLTEALVLGFVGGWLLHEGVRPHHADSATQAVVTPAVLFGGAVAASCAAQMIVLQTSVDYTWPFLRRVVEFLWRDYAFDRNRFQALAASMLLLEGTAIFIALVTLAHRHTSLAQKVARMVVACGAGVAALNIHRLLTLWLRSGRSLTELAVGAGSVRISSAFPDFNAAGSYLVMVLWLSGALALTRERLRAGWIVATCLVLGALWLTGSRTAIVAAPAAAVLMLAFRAFLRRRSWVRPVLASAVVMVLVGLAVVYSWHGRPRQLLLGASIRAGMARTSLRMLATQPAFGVGVGRFYSRSSEFLSPELRRMFPRENSHNNFLQILAELGVVGFTLFCWILVAVARSIWSASVASRASPALIGPTGGLIAFLLTCLSGHPLLIPEVSCAFWLVLGLTVGLAQKKSAVAGSPSVEERWLSRRRVAWAVALFLLVSVPIQGRLMLAEADLEHAAIGFSGWQTDSEGVPFRWMVRQAQFYVSSAARVVKLPLKLEATGTVDRWPVEILRDGHPATRILVESHAWREVRFVMPQAEHQPRFWRIELRVPSVYAEGGTDGRGPASAPPRIQVGRPELTPSPP
jgi:hypothetical protein